MAVALSHQGFLQQNAVKSGAKSSHHNDGLLPKRQSSIPAASNQPNSTSGSSTTTQPNRLKQPVCSECDRLLPNQIVFDKIESIIWSMQDEHNGLPVKTAKSFMSKIPSVFTGTDLIQWMMKNLKLDDQQEALHLANLIASHGYIFPIEDHTLSIKNDCTFYRFQTPCLWPSNNTDPENTDYAVYLCKRTMQGKTRLELADYEAENLARLQKMYSRRWEFIFMQAESQAKVDKKRDKLERKVLDSQERAFWDVYRPVPGCVNTIELDIKKACRLSKTDKRCDDCQNKADLAAQLNQDSSNSNLKPVESSSGSSAPILSSLTTTTSTSTPSSTPTPTITTLSTVGGSQLSETSDSDKQFKSQTTSSVPHSQNSDHRPTKADNNTIATTSTSGSSGSTTGSASGSGLSSSSKGTQERSRSAQPSAQAEQTSGSCSASEQPSRPSSAQRASHHHHHHHIHQQSSITGPSSFAPSSGQHHHHHHPHHHHHHHHHRQCPHHKQHHHHHHHAQSQTQQRLSKDIGGSVDLADTPSSGSGFKLRNSSRNSTTNEPEANNSSDPQSKFRSQSALGPAEPSSASMSSSSANNITINSSATTSHTHLERKSSLNLKDPQASQVSQAATTSSSSDRPQHLMIGSDAGQVLAGARKSSVQTQRPLAMGSSGGASSSTTCCTTSGPAQSTSSGSSQQLSNVTNEFEVMKLIPASSGTTGSAASGSRGQMQSSSVASIASGTGVSGVITSKVTQSYLSFFKQWGDYDPFIAQPIPSNPWQSDSTELWDSERQTKDVHCRRVRRWAFSLKELLSDPAGREQFYKFLEKEFSAENLKFWDAVQELKRVHGRDVARRVEVIWNEYLAQDANCPINIDSKSYETSKKNMAKNKNNRYIFDEAAGHVYQLMKNDSYPRYLRSDMYKDYKEASEKKQRSNQVAFDVFKPQITTLKQKFNF